MVDIKFVIGRESVIGQDQVCILFRRLNEFLKTWLHEILILLKEVRQESLIIRVLSRHFENTPRQSNVIICINKNFKVHFLHELIVAENEVTFDDNHLGWFDMLSGCKTHHYMIVINWLVEGLSVLQSLDTLV